MDALAESQDKVSQLQERIDNLEEENGLLRDPSASKSQSQEIIAALSKENQELKCINLNTDFSIQEKKFERMTARIQASHDSLAAQLDQERSVRLHHHTDEMIADPLRTEEQEIRKVHSEESHRIDSASPAAHADSSSRLRIVRRLFVASASGIAGRIWRRARIERGRFLGGEQGDHSAERIETVLVFSLNILESLQNLQPKRIEIIPFVQHLHRRLVHLLFRQGGLMASHLERAEKCRRMTGRRIGQSRGASGGCTMSRSRVGDSIVEVGSARGGGMSRHFEKGRKGIE